MRSTRESRGALPLTLKLIELPDPTVDFQPVLKSKLCQDAADYYSKARFSFYFGLMSTRCPLSKVGLSSLVNKSEHSKIGRLIQLERARCAVELKKKTNYVCVTFSVVPSNCQCKGFCKLI